MLKPSCNKIDSGPPLTNKKKPDFTDEKLI